MNVEEQKAFAEANKAIHPVETQWHYPHMTKFGWQTNDKTGIGFVRSYTYHHPQTDIKVIATTGYSADYWRAYKDNKEVDGGFWSDLEPYLEKQQVKICLNQ